MATKTILVASATANTGSKVVEQLSASGQVNIKALVRNPDGEPAKALAALPRVTLVKGDFNDAASLEGALQGVDRALLVSSAGEHEQYDREVAFIAAADKAGIEVTVRVSTANILISLESTGVYARAHARIEQYIEQHKSRVIDLRPDWYMSNILWQAGEIKGTGKITYPVTPEQAANSKFAAVDTRDVAGAGTAILLAPKETVDKLLQIRGLEVHGPELISFGDQLAAISEVTGKPVELQYLDPNAWAKMLQSFGSSELMATSFRDTVLKAVGAAPTPRPYTPETTPELLAIYKPKHTFKEWAKENAAAFA